MTDDGMINVESFVSHLDGAPFVKLQWGNESGQLTVEEARQHALNILQCAEAAEFDAAYWRFLTTDMQVKDPKQAAYMVGLLREHRGKRHGYVWKRKDRTE